MVPKPIPFLGLMLLATGCTLAPRYTTPAAPVPRALPPGADAPGGAVASGLPWETFFTDPGLRSVVKLALANSRDLRIASLNVERARAMYRIQRSALLPDVGVQGSGDKFRVPPKMSSYEPAGVYEEDSVMVGVLSWEVDFFGRLRSLKDQALNQYLATEQAGAAARISLVSAVAQGWVACAADAESLELASEILDSQKASYDLVRASREQGVASDLDLRQAQAQVDGARADRARLQALVAMDRNALDLLAGAPVPADLLPRRIDGTRGTRELAAGLSSDVLLRRPDIMAAEYQLKAATANIGAARAAFFPRIELTGGVGTMASGLSGLFTSGSRAWSFTPQVTVPIFAGGSLMAGLKVAKVDRDVALAQYEMAIQSAFREVANGLAQRSALLEQLQAQQSLVDSLDAARHLSEARQREGLDGLAGVLMAERALEGARQGLAALRLAYQANQITLFKALGGQA
jgi:multidrug efflux system outer membrane protein